jgi:hypothetical protein
MERYHIGIQRYGGILAGRAQFRNAAALSYGLEPPLPKRPLPFPKLLLCRLLHRWRNIANRHDAADIPHDVSP